MDQKQKKIKTSPLIYISNRYFNRLIAIYRQRKNFVSLRKKNTDISYLSTVYCFLLTAWVDQTKTEV